MGRVARMGASATVPGQVVGSHRPVRRGRAVRRRVRGRSFLAGEPGQQDGGGLGAPRKLYGATAVDDDQRAGVGADDLAHQPVLRYGKSQGRAVVALALVAFGGADADEGHVCVPGGLHRGCEGGGGVGGGW